MKTPFAEHDGKLYIQIRACGIHPLCICVDGWLKIFSFRGTRHNYILLDDAITWHERELAETHGKSGSQKTLDMLKDCRVKLSAKGEVTQ